MLCSITMNCFTFLARSLFHTFILCVEVESQVTRIKV